VMTRKNLAIFLPAPVLKMWYMLSLPHQKCPFRLSKYAFHWCKQTHSQFTCMSNGWNWFTTLAVQGHIRKKQTHIKSVYLIYTVYYLCMNSRNVFVCICVRACERKSPFA
jgi:hypothetical protein